eukprot:132833-Prorocentrum_minimum.AAC.2
MRGTNLFPPPSPGLAVAAHGSPIEYRRGTNLFPPPSPGLAVAAHGTRVRSLLNRSFPKGGCRRGCRLEGTRPALAAAAAAAGFPAGSAADSGVASISTCASVPLKPNAFTATATGA